MDKVSYALGLSIGNNFLNSGIKDLQIEDFVKGLSDVLKEEKPEIIDNRLRNNPPEFEYLRNHYDHPREPRAYRVRNATPDEQKLLAEMEFQAG